MVIPTRKTFYATTSFFDYASAGVSQDITLDVQDSVWDAFGPDWSLVFDIVEEGAGNHFGEVEE